jgi:hypothetical protein
LRSQLEQLVQEAFVAAEIATLQQFKLKYRSEIIDMLRQIPRPRDVPWAPLLQQERQAAFNQAREEAVAKMLKRYQDIVRERVARSHTPQPVEEWPPDVVAVM